MTATVVLTVIVAALAMMVCGAFLPHLAGATTPAPTGPNASAQSSAFSSGSQASSSSGSSSAFGGSASQYDQSAVTLTGATTRVQVLPSVVPATPPSTLAAGNLLQHVSACGPLQQVVRTDVRGTFVGLVSDTHVDQGDTQELRPYIDDLGQRVDYWRRGEVGGDVRLFGHQVVTTSAVIGVAGARNIALGGGSAGGWGQAGGGASASIQRLVTTIQLRECEAGVERVAKPEPAPMPQPVLPVEPRVVTRTVVRKVYVPAPAPQMVLPVVPVRIDPSCCCAR